MSEAIITANPFLARVLRAMRPVDPAEEAERRAHEQRTRRAALDLRADACDVPRERGLRAVCLDETPGVTPALVAVREALAWRAANSTSEGSVAALRALAGPPGTGKSCALAWAVTHTTRSACYVPATRVTGTPRNGYSTNEEAWSRWLDADLLCVDDVGTERGDVGLIGWLFTERASAGLLTLVSTNVPQKTFAERYADARQADRLENGQRRAGLSWWVALPGKSLRDPANAAALTSKGA